MADEKSDGVKGVVGGWVKAFVTSIVGLISGAVIMYVTPLVNNAIKPPKPVANFASQVDGLTVSFNNRSTGGVQGWWDFGDGAALEPFDPKIDIVKHTYAKPGAYSVKLTLHNLLGEDNDRTAQVMLDGTVVAANPEIVSFKLEPLAPDQRVPAVYRLVSNVKAATHCILSLGDERTAEVLDASGNLERYVTFNEMGNYTVRFAAINGKKVAEKMETVYISPNDSSNPLAKLLVSYKAVRVERSQPRVVPIRCDWMGGSQASVTAFRKERTVDQGKSIISAELVNIPGEGSAVRNVNVAIAADKKHIVVSGEMLRPAGATSNAPPPSWVAHVKVVTELRSPPETITCGDVMMAVNMNSPTKIPLQPLAPGYEIIQKKVKLELWDGSHKFWECEKAVTDGSCMFNNQPCKVTALPQPDGFVIRVDGPSITAAPPARPEPVGPIRKVGFEAFNPLLPKKSK
jgi:PKD repeat protein